MLKKLLSLHTLLCIVFLLGNSLASDKKNIKVNLSDGRSYELEHAQFTSLPHGAASFVFDKGNYSMPVVHFYVAPLVYEFPLEQIKTILVSSNGSYHDNFPYSGSISLRNGETYSGSIGSPYKGYPQQFQSIKGVGELEGFSTDLEVGLHHVKKIDFIRDASKKVQATVTKNDLTTVNILSDIRFKMDGGDSRFDTTLLKHFDIKVNTDTTIKVPIDDVMSLALEGQIDERPRKVLCVLKNNKQITGSTNFIVTSDLDGDFLFRFSGRLFNRRGDVYIQSIVFQ